MIRLNKVSFSYSPKHPVLRDISFVLRPGERVIVLGANGAGKSTLLSVLNGLVHPCGGNYSFAERPVNYTRSGLRELRKQVGTVVQDPDDQLFGATVLQDVAMGPLERGDSEPTARERGLRAIESMGILHLADRPIHALSLGEKKRAALAGVLVTSPAVILLDEPSAGLDAGGEDSLFHILNGLSSIICIATHDTSLLVRWASRVLLLQAGRLVYDGTPDKLLEDWDNRTAGCGLRKPSIVALERNMRLEMEIPTR